MNETNQVELDTDDVQEESVNVQAKTTEDKTEKFDVDLGYTDPIASDTKAKIVQEDSQDTEKQVENTDNLQDVSQTVQKRIDKLTRRYREAERREKEAIRYAKSIQEKMNKSKETEKNYVEEFDARVDSQREQVKQKLKKATEEQNPDAIMEATDELTRLGIEKEKARIKKSEIEQAAKQAESTQAQAPQQAPQQPVMPSPKADAWAQENPWFGEKIGMTQTAYQIHAELAKEGFDLESDEYYNEIDKRMRNEFPNDFFANGKKQPVQTVASAGRKQEGRRTVRLTRSQVAIAKKLGVPLEEYAKHVKE